MARSTVMRLRATWLNVHKWIGICLAILIIPISITGAALVWDGWLDEQLNPQRYDVSTGDARLTPSQYADAARTRAGSTDVLTSLRYDEDGDGPVIASFTQVRQGASERGGERGGPPQRTNVWLDPGTGQVLDAAGSNSGLIRIFHNLHGNLMVPGWGRTIVGWVGVFMFISCLTGIWLWWPIGGSFRRGFRWKRQNSTNANIHHLVGFWILLPLAMLSFTGLWISFPGVFGGGPQGPRPAPATPLAQTHLSPDAALAAAQPMSRNARLTGITWPTDRAPQWKFAFDGVGEIAVNDATAEAIPPQRAPGGQQRPLMRRWHDGTGMGIVWQVLIFLGGIIPAILSITGLVMWWRSRGWKKALARRRREKAALQPAE